jgi:subtilisin family serine protease
MRLRACLAALFGAVAAALAWSAPAHAADGGSGQILVMLRMPAPHYQPNAGYQGAYGGEEGRGARMRAANRLAKAYGLSVVTEWPMPRLGVHCFVMQSAAGARAEDVAARLSKEASVSWSEPLHVYHAQNSGPDPLLQTQPAESAWHLSDLHRTATGRNVQVAVIDSAIDATHPDLAGQVALTRNFMQDAPRAGGEMHGTGVAGVIAAREGNGVGIAGVAPEARLLGLRACAQDDGGATACDSLSVARALDFALGRGAQIINLSFSGPPDMLLSRLLDLALARGMFVVAAYDRGQAKGGFPASYPGVIAVDDIAAQRGAFQAPGRDIPTSEPGGRWGVVNGSSFAAAHVSGLLALVREHDPKARGASTLVIGETAGTIDACATLLKTPAPQCGPPKDVLAGR